MLFFLQYETDEGDGIATGFAIFIMIIYGYPLILASSIPFAIVALIFGIKMLIQQSRKKLISYNVGMLITSCVLLPFMVVGFMIGSGIIFKSTLKLLLIILIVVIAIAYVVGIIAQIATIVVLKKSPEESAPPVTDQ